MKKVTKISLHQLDKAELSKKQQDLLFGGGTPGWCKCGSCASQSGVMPSVAANMSANLENGYTITGSNTPICLCASGIGSSVSVMAVPSK